MTRPFVRVRSFATGVARHCRDDSQSLTVLGVAKGNPQAGDAGGEGLGQRKNGLGCTLRELGWTCQKCLRTVVGAHWGFVETIKWEVPSEKPPRVECLLARRGGEFLRARAHRGFHNTVL
jgi:hypothetical protein